MQTIKTFADVTKNWRDNFTTLTGTLIEVPQANEVLIRYLTQFGWDLNTPMDAKVLSNMDHSLRMHLRFLESLKFDQKQRDGVEEIMRECRSIAESILRPDALPRDFGEALRELIFRHDYKSCFGFAIKHELDHGQIKNWCDGGRRPTKRSRWAIEKIESIFQLKKGTLVQRAYAGDPEYLLDSTVQLDPYGTRHKAAIAKHYRLKVLPAHVKKELADYTRFKSQSAFDLEDWGAKTIRFRGWSAGKDGTYASAKIFTDELKAFLGFVTASADHPDPMLKGMGIKLSDTTLALYAVPSIMRDFIRFKKRRMVHLSDSAARTLHVSASLLTQDSG